MFSTEATSFWFLLNLNREKLSSLLNLLQSHPLYPWMIPK